MLLIASCICADAVFVLVATVSELHLHLTLPAKHAIVQFSATRPWSCHVSAGGVIHCLARGPSAQRPACQRCNCRQPPLPSLPPSTEALTGSRDFHVQCPGR